MAYLKFNKPELVNLSYSLKREIIEANSTGSYCNTSIVTCNTRRYHGLLAVPVDSLGGRRHMLLSSVDESLVINGRQFNFGIHCYGDMYEPRGNKFIIDFESDPIPVITYKVGTTVFQKSIMLIPDSDQLMIRYKLVSSPAPATLLLKPFLAYRSVHSLTHENSVARLDGTPVQNGMAYCMYEGLPVLNLQLSDSKSAFAAAPDWYRGVTYSDEYRRGFDCVEDLYVPGSFSLTLKPGECVVLSASTKEENTAGLKAKFTRVMSSLPSISGPRASLLHWAEVLKNNRNGHKRITSGLSWLYTGLLRETLFTLPGLTLCAGGDMKEFEEILDNLIADEQERLFHRTTQVESPLLLASCLQNYIDYGADPKHVWQKYGETVKGVIESYAPGHRKEVAMQPNGLLWAQMDGVALTWINAYVDGRPVTERPGYQVEVNAFWYDSICFALEMEERYGPKGSDFIKTWTKVRDLVKANYLPMFWNPERKCLSDYVGPDGPTLSIRPNQLWAISVAHSPVDEETEIAVMKVVMNELVTRRGIRTLSPRDNRYRSVYEGSQVERDLAYHQGCTRPWLLLPYVKLGFKHRGAAFIGRAEWLIKGFAEDLNKHGVGAFSELYDGDPPHEPHGAIVSAMTVAALLRICDMLDKYKKEVAR